MEHPQRNGPQVHSTSAALLPITSPVVRAGVPDWDNDRHPLRAVSDNSLREVIAALDVMLRAPVVTPEMASNPTIVAEQCRLQGACDVLVILHGALQRKEKRP